MKEKKIREILDNLDISDIALPIFMILLGVFSVQNMESTAYKLVYVVFFTFLTLGIILLSYHKVISDIRFDKRKRLFQHITDIHKNSDIQTEKEKKEKLKQKILEDEKLGPEDIWWED